MATRKGRVGPSSFEAAAAVVAAGAVVVADAAIVAADAVVVGRVDDAPGTRASPYASFPRGW